MTWQVILLGIAMQLPLEPEVNGTKGVRAWVISPMLSNCCPIACRASSSQPQGIVRVLTLMGKDLKKVEKVPHFHEPGVNTE
jgi:hypothetical protein